MTNSLMINSVIKWSGPKYIDLKFETEDKIISVSFKKYHHKIMFVWWSCPLYEYYIDKIESCFVLTVLWIIQQ